MGRVAGEEASTPEFLLDKKKIPSLTQRYHVKEEVIVKEETFLKKLTFQSFLLAFLCC